MSDAQELHTLPLKEYFNRVALLLSRGIDLSQLTDLFTQQPYEETRPHLIWRKLKPSDPRFSLIQIIYDAAAPDKINAIYWDFAINLSELSAIFGPYNWQNEPNSESTAFVFPAPNPAVSLVKTRHPQWLTALPNEAGFGYVDRESGAKMVLPDPEFSFVQISLKK